MKKLTKLAFAGGMVAAGSASVSAQLRWDPSLWTNKNDNQRIEILDNKVVKAIPFGNDNAHIRNAEPLHFSEDEPYLIVKIAVDHEFVIARNYSGWCFYNEFARLDGTPLSDEEAATLGNMVYHNQYFKNVPGMQRVLFDDAEMWDPEVPFDVFVIDLNNENYNILSNGDLDLPAMIDWTEVDDTYKRHSAITFEMCCWGRDGVDKNVYLQQNASGATSLGVTYEYIATAGMYDILDEDELVDPKLVKELIDNYKNGNGGREVRAGEESHVATTDAESVRIFATKGIIRAKGAVEMNVWNPAGVKVASVNGDELYVAPGLYIVAATDENGAVKTAKVSVR